MKHKHVDWNFIIRWSGYICLTISVWLLLITVSLYSSMVPPGEPAFQQLWLGRFAFIFAGVGMGGFVFWRYFREELMEVFYWALTIGLIALGGWQAMWGLAQIYGWVVSHHALYPLTGSFYNPGPYSGYLAMVLPICLHHWLNRKKVFNKRLVRWISYPAFIVGVLILWVLPAGMSRSAWLAAFVSTLWVLAIHFSWHKKMVRFGMRFPKRLAVVAVIMLIGTVGLGYGFFHLKHASANGRLLMWKIGVETALQKPLTGYGYGGFPGAYGEAQEAYFTSGQATTWEEEVAGSPEYAFNEYIQVAIEHGIPFLIGLLILLLFSLRRDVKRGWIGLCGALISILVFCFSSYPMQIPGFAIVLLLLVTVCWVHRRKDWALLSLLFVGLGWFCHQENRYNEFKQWERAKMWYNTGSYVSAEESYRELYSSLNDQGAFLFEYGHCLHKLGKYQWSTIVLKRAMNYSCDPMILNIIGKNEQALGHYEAAEKWFLRSTNRLPGRIYPYYLLAKLYASEWYNKPDKLKQMVHLVLTKEPKVQSTAVKEMREEVLKLLQNIIDRELKKK